jgi:hypothetical protein
MPRNSSRAFRSAWWQAHVPDAGPGAARHAATTTNLRRSTAARDEAYLRLYVTPGFGAMPLGAIGQRDVRAWVAELSGRGLAPATVQKAYQLLGKVMGAAVDAGMIAQTPCRRVPCRR